MNKPWETHPQFIYTYNYNQADIRAVELLAARALYEAMDEYARDFWRNHKYSWQEAEALAMRHFESLLWPEGRS